MKFKINPDELVNVRIKAPSLEVFTKIMGLFTLLGLKHRNGRIPMNRLDLWEIGRDQTTVGFYSGRININRLSSSIDARRNIMPLEEFINKYIDTSPEQPSTGAPYFYIDTRKRISRKAVWDNSEIDMLRLEFHNVFKRRMDALKKLSEL
jgi:hypothetical protein